MISSNASDTKEGRRDLVEKEKKRRKVKKMFYKVGDYLVFSSSKALHMINTPGISATSGSIVLKADHASESYGG